MMKHKILYVKNSSSKFNLNTYNVQAIGLGKAFCKLGFDYDFLFFSKEDSILREEYIAGHRLRIISRKGIRILRSEYCHSVLNEDFLGQYDFIISTEYGQVMTYCLSKVSKNVVLYSGPYYNLFKLPFMSPIYDFFFTKEINDQCKAKFVKSILAKEYLEAKGYTNLVNIGVGLDVERFDRNVPIQAETQKIIDFMTTNDCVLYVGSLSDRKNFPFLIDVYTKLKSERNNIKFVVIGKGDPRYVKRYVDRIPGQYRDDLLRIEKIDNSQLKYIYPLAKAFLLPSKQEIFGMVLLESMYLGAPVITSRNGGSTTLIEGRNTGTIISEFDVHKWVNAIEQYLDNPSETTAMTERAHQLISRDFVWTSLAKKILQTVEENTYQKDRQ
ncbi:glycosyltransferase family 4 protein [Bifidobacterium dentium]|uniref:glycosyltransferase family 4 protein n=1 Tax=Bifidobacterium dentium TaxID=1689 RepID=UPI0018C23441|nr:glycosyltransferase family 4 protein [Bifidobacterium dentium]MBF9710985.1 glycosyltransferase family 4 protein [Bifidobacterium dentium]